MCCVRSCLCNSGDSGGPSSLLGGPRRLVNVLPQLIQSVRAQLRCVSAHAEVGRRAAAAQAHERAIVRARRGRLFIKQPQVDVLGPGQPDARL